MSFVHLRVHSEYSVVDGTLRVDDAAAAAAADGQPALAITDLNNLFGAVKFYKACRGKGVKPIIGADLWMEPRGAERTPSRLLVLVQDRSGYHHLCQLLARAWTGNTQRAQAWVRWDWLDELQGGLIALSGADGGEVGQALLAGDRDRAQAAAERLSALFPGRLYLELQRFGAPNQEALVRATAALASQLALPVVATHPVQFLHEADFDAHEARVCVADGETLANPRRVRRFSREQYFRSCEQMTRAFADIPSAVANTLAIARRCNLSLRMGQSFLPDFPTPPGPDGKPLPLDAFLHEQSRLGLEYRLTQRFPDSARRDAERPRYMERLAYEIGVIVKMGFPGYFLIVADFINWARDNGCPVGPGRGSGAGSVVAWALRITDLDPLQYQLLFERFLNPERISMPDFDIDFCQANRDRVIDYVKAKYGREAVSQIATFGTMAAKAALRDIGRVLGMAFGQVDSIAKLVPAPPGKSVTLARPPNPPEPGLIYARLEAPELEQREKAEEEVAELLALASQVEGLVRNVGMHAGGVLIAPGRITDFCPLYQQPGSDSAVSQFDKDDVEAVGLVKFDFLGLATLTILELARGFIQARDPRQADFSFETVPLDDAKVYQLFADARTEAVFQFESRGMQGMLRDAKPTRLEDLIALNAMFRPGPMENIPSFCARKNGREPVAYPHPLLAPILGETYGIFVYQEQVMQAAQVMGGYSLGAADLLRRAMGKKKPEEMAKQRDIFRAGAGAQGIDERTADDVFDLMEKFAGYGFNKSHAAAYSLLAYHTAWLKVHDPAAFFAANMTVEMDDTDKLKLLLEDGRGFGIAFDAPDINQGVHRFEPIGLQRVRWGLGAIKGTGAGAIESLVAARTAGGPFRSLFDFCARVDRGRMNKRAVEAMIRAGAFDALHADRAATLACVGLAFDWADAQQAHAHQGGLFDFDATAHGASTQEPAMPQVAAWTVRERLLHEKAALGCCLSGHLFDAYEQEVRRFARRGLDALQDSRDLQLAVGIVGELRVASGQRGRVAIFRLEDGITAVEAVASEELLEAHRDLLREDELVVLQVRAQTDRFGGGLRIQVQAMWSLAGARARFGRYLSVAVADGLPPLADLVRSWPARRQTTDAGELLQGLGVRLRLRRPQAVAELDLGDAGRFWPCDEALARFKALAEAGDAAIVYE